MLRLKGMVKGLLFVLIPLIIMKTIGFSPLVMGIIFLVIAAISFMLGYESFKSGDKHPLTEKSKAFHLTLSPLAFLLSIVAFIMAFTD
jgi:ABC-type multidrug transport system permease subunit